MQSIVKTIGLSHKYSTNWAIRDIDIDISSNGVLGLLGSNGAGKSTTMNIICGVLNQTQGEVFINGISIQKNPIEAKKSIGFLPQSPPLYLDLTVREYLRYAANLRLVSSSAISAAIEDVMEKCALKNVENRLLKNLSGGYRQRVGIAQAIIHKPRLVVLDEPTNGLDPIQIGEMRNLIKEISYEHTVIISSHILSEIQMICERILMIEQGQLIFSDTMDAFNNYIAPQSMFVAFESPPSLDSLKEIQGVSRVEKISNKSFRIFYDGQYAISESLILKSVSEGWRLTELTLERKSIDEVFKQLSSKTA